LYATKNGIIQVMSEHSFADTFERLESQVALRGLITFARIDFQRDAEKAGLAMRPIRLLIFGNPRAGTPLMIAAPTLAIDFPLKVLVSEDESGRVWVSYNSPQYLEVRHNIPNELLKNISGIVGIVESVAR
jgi:uncharacterized protein (DUF302 family)